MDGRTKPDITAPGNEIISAVSSFDYDFKTWKNYMLTDSIISPLNGRTYKYAAESGTSLSSPVVTGAVALMLQANPNLTPQQVITILKNTAREDEFTGAIPAEGSNTWGWGKIDIYAAVKEADRMKSIAHKSTPFKGSQFIIYPNPSATEFTIELDNYKDKYVKLELMDLSGKVLISESMKIDSFHKTLSIDSSNLKEGVYLIKTSTEDGNNYGKIVVAR